MNILPADSLKSGRVGLLSVIDKCFYMKAGWVSGAESSAYCGYFHLGSQWDDSNLPHRNFIVELNYVQIRPLSV